MSTMWNQLKTIVLLGGLSAAAVAAASGLAPGWAWAFVGLAVLMNLGAYLYSDRLVLRMHGARPVDIREYPTLHLMNTELARQAGIPAPGLYLIEADYANAFATGRGPGRAAIALTTGLLARLDRREVRGVLAHEIAHVKNRDVLLATIAAMVAAVISGIANALQLSALSGAGQNDDESPSPIAMLAFAVVAPIAATLVQLAISRSREFVADETAARLTQDPEALASALRRLAAAAAHGGMEPIPAPATASLFIVAPFSSVTPRLLALFSTHPPVQQRVERLLRMATRWRRVA
jgi:heat shock protein HtpX